MQHLEDHNAPTRSDISTGLPLISRNSKFPEFCEDMYSSCEMLVYVPNGLFKLVHSIMILGMFITLWLRYKHFLR
jgi:hypothetical protein